MGFLNRLQEEHGDSLLHLIFRFLQKLHTTDFRSLMLPILLIVIDSYYSCLSVSNNFLVPGYLLVASYLLVIFTPYSGALYKLDMFMITKRLLVRVTLNLHAAALKNTLRAEDRFLLFKDNVLKTMSRRKTPGQYGCLQMRRGHLLG